MTVEKSASVRFSLPYCHPASPLKELMAMSILPYRHLANNFANGEMSIYDVANLPHFLIGDWRNGEYGTQWDPIRRFLEAALGLRGLRVVIKIEGQTGS